MQIVFTAAATHQWRGLSADVQERLDKKLAAFARTGAGDVKRLKGSPDARLRVGNWRITFYVEGDNMIITAVGHRREVYD